MISQNLGSLPSFVTQCHTSSSPSPLNVWRNLWIPLTSISRSMDLWKICVSSFCLIDKLSFPYILILIFFCFSNHQGAVFFRFLLLSLLSSVLQWYHGGCNFFSEYDQSNMLFYVGYYGKGGEKMGVEWLNWRRFQAIGETWRKWMQTIPTFWVLMTTGAGIAFLYFDLQNGNCANAGVSYFHVGLGVTCSPRDLRFAGSNPVELFSYCG